MPEESLLTGEVRALIGREAPAAPARITRRALHRAMDVYLGHHTESYADGDELPGWVLEAIDSEAEPLPTPMLLPQSLLISNEWAFERPLRLGEELQASNRIANISERFGGRFGYSLDVRTETTFRDAAGAIVARSSRNLMQYDPAGAEGGNE